MRFLLLAIPTLMLSCIASASPLAFGPLKLGMTNAEVAKLIPMRECHPESDRMICIGTIATKDVNNDIQLTFVRNSKKLDRVEMRLRDWASDDARLPSLMAQLNFTPCRIGQQGRTPDWYLKEECFEPPDQVRTIAWDPGRSSRISSRVRAIVVTVQHHPSAYRLFLKRKQEEGKRAAERNESERFVAGQ